MAKSSWRAAFGLALMGPLLTGQSTQGILSGRVLDALTGQPVPDAVVSWRSISEGLARQVRAGAGGWYSIPSISPGVYHLRIEAAGHQAQEVFELEVSVAARLELETRLRPSGDVLDSGVYHRLTLPGTRYLVSIFGPDVDTSRTQLVQAPRAAESALDASVSAVIPRRVIHDLPLAGRDVFATLVTQAGVTADSGAARGLGLAASGQRPSSANFLLDGVEHNNTLISGPLTVLAPEAVEEYRLSTNTFAAEFGGSTGFIANAATRAGGGAWHGLAYFYGKQAPLNANGFQQNRQGFPKTLDRERQPGFQLGGPVLRQRLFASSALESFRSYGASDPFEIRLPTRATLDFAGPGSISRSLLDQFPALAVPAGPRLFETVTARAPSRLHRLTALQRADWLPAGGAHRITGRVSLSRLTVPDFIWSPYPDFSSALHQNDTGVMAGVESAPKPGLSNEARFSWSVNEVRWDRAHPEIATLSSDDGVALPGSPAFYAYSNRGRTIEARDSVTWVRGRHLVKVGGSLLARTTGNRQDSGNDGRYLFQTVLDFALDSPRFFYVASSRADARAIPDPRRRYRQRQFSAFAQDTLRATERLALNFGLRYENFGAPEYTGGTRDFTLQPGPGASFEERLRGATLVPPDGSNPRIYAPDNSDWAARFGFTYRAGLGLVLRGAYGIFHDRLFDNAWQNVRNNSFQLLTLPIRTFEWDYLQPAQSALGALSLPTAEPGIPSATMLQPGLRTAYAQNYFMGATKQVADAWSVTVNGMGSLGRKLLTTDLVNRDPAIRAPRLIAYRGNQGVSSYHGLAATLRYRSSRGFLQASYTFSHAIDTQSEPLAGDFFDLSFARVSAGARRAGIATFSRQFDNRGDRGSADFDQRHNFVVYSLWDLPGRSLLLRNWKAAQTAAFRTGFPYTVFAPTVTGPGGVTVLNTRADLIRPNPASALPAPGGEVLLDASAFRAPLAGTQGNTGRNAFAGPGMYTVDLSVSRSFTLPWLGESGRLTLRADAFNVLNHANLSQPDAVVGAAGFAFAPYGRRGRETGFPAAVPFTENGRQIQLLLRLEF
ncbi:MAG: carboxypeptidase regulatory-like domain-containing protein [Bryobacteraceae bacterium]